ncbi:UNVERIFIED_CONTAM: ATP synthase subunit delta', mitochondrial [Sesamum radiatum]|uniref:ATP synthase subunit delta', mitochondrial n=1 Tax=Sesamum radiatum TaxID=300843 RepID=A0AAW2VK85_SESRA
MFRRVAVRLLSHHRPFSSSEVPSEPVADDLFMAAWRRIVPNLDPPRTPLAFMQPRPPTASAASTPSKLTINLVSHYSSELSNKQTLFCGLQFRSVHFLFNTVPALVLLHNLMENV